MTNWKIWRTLLPPAFLVGDGFACVCLSFCLSPKYLKNWWRYFNFVSQVEYFMGGEELINFWSRSGSRWPTDHRICPKPIFAHKLVLDQQEPSIRVEELINFWLRSDSRWPTDRNMYTKPIFAHIFLLDWDIDLKFCV